MQTPEVNIQEKAESPLDQGVLDLPTNQEPEKNKTFGSIVARTITGVLYVVAIVLCIQHPMGFSFSLPHSPDCALGSSAPLSTLG